MFFPSTPELVRSQWSCSSVTLNVMALYHSPTLRLRWGVWGSRSPLDSIFSALPKSRLRGSNMAWRGVCCDAWRSCLAPTVWGGHVTQGENPHADTLCSPAINRHQTWLQLSPCHPAPIRARSFDFLMTPRGWRDKVNRRRGSWPGVVLHTGTIYVNILSFISRKWGAFQ